MWHLSLRAEIEEIFSLLEGCVDLGDPGTAHSIRIRERSGKKTYVPKPRKVRVNTCGHPERKHYARGMCKSCSTVAYRKKAA